MYPGHVYRFRIMLSSHVRPRQIVLAFRLFLSRFSFPILVRTGINRDPERWFCMRWSCVDRYASTIWTLLFGAVICQVRKQVLARRRNYTGQEEAARLSAASLGVDSRRLDTGMTGGADVCRPDIGTLSRVIITCHYHVVCTTPADVLFPTTCTSFVY